MVISWASQMTYTIMGLRMTSNEEDAAEEDAEQRQSAACPTNAKEDEEESKLSRALHILCSLQNLLLLLGVVLFLRNSFPRKTHCLYSCELAQRRRNVLFSRIC